MVTQMLRQEDAEVFKLYSHAKLAMMREALGKLDRQANERIIASTEQASTEQASTEQASTEQASRGISCTFLVTIDLLVAIPKGTKCRFWKG